MLLLLAAAVLAQDYYPLEEGYSWTYKATVREKERETVKKVTGKEKVGEHDCFVVEDDGMGGDFQKLYLSRTKEGLTVRNMRRKIEQTYPWLKFPFDKGARWTTLLSSPETRDKAAIEFVVGDEEEVEVPAGKFKARRVLMTGSEEGKDKRVEVSMWYAPDVGEVQRTVKLVRGEKVEEMSYKLLKFEKGSK